MQVSEKAARKALQIAREQGHPTILRVGVKGGGCNGLTYYFAFAEGKDAPREGDQTWNVGELTVVLDPRSADHLQETVLDYDTNLLRGGFKFSNPAARSTCSCGESFAPAKMDGRGA